MIKKSKKFIIILLIIFTLSGFFGYTYYSDVTTLLNAEVTIKDIHLHELSFTYCKLKINIDIKNPSDRDISSLSSVFNIYIAENFVGLGSFSNVFIPAQSTKENDVTITIYYTNVAVAVVDGIKKGNFDLNIKGEASGKVLFDLITVSKQLNVTKAYS
jgi:hypothetical protein